MIPRAATSVRAGTRKAHDTTGSWEVPFSFVLLLLVPYSINAWLAGCPKMMSEH